MNRSHKTKNETTEVVEQNKCRSNSKQGDKWR